MEKGISTNIWHALFCAGKLPKYLEVLREWQKRGDKAGGFQPLAGHLNFLKISRMRGIQTAKPIVEANAESE